MTDNEMELLKARAELAWKWFEFHANQRAVLFNWFLIVTGVLMNAYVLAVKESLFAVATTICLFGVLEAISFFVFDTRNRELTNYGEGKRSGHLVQDSGGLRQE